MSDSQSYQFSVTIPGERLDKTLVAQLGDQLTRSQIQALIKEGQVAVNGEAVKAGIKLKGGETISITVPPPKVDPTVEPEDIPLEILYEDQDLAVVNKPAGLVVHPGSGNETGTLVNALLARYPEIAEISHAPKRRGIVHRLDRGTSGLILIAKNAFAMRRLMEQFQHRTVEKTYLALLERPPKTSTGRISAPIDRDPVRRKQMAVSRTGKPAVSEFTVVERFDDGKALVSVNLLTGRTHQIRVHMAFLDCPIVGDRIYGFRKQRLLERQFLHAARLCFDQPRTNERICVEAPLPQELETVLVQLRRQSHISPLD